MLDTTVKFMEKHKDLLEAHEQEITLAQMQKLREAINAQDKDLIQKETEHLNDISRPYAERVMDAALKDAMKGKKII
jgi:molecular chaperone HscA